MRVVIQTNNLFAAALIIEGPPISIFSIPSSNSIPPAGSNFIVEGVTDSLLQHQMYLWKSLVK